jgi:hypothetical protein
VYQLGGTLVGRFFARFGRERFGRLEEASFEELDGAGGGAAGVLDPVDDVRAERPVPLRLAMAISLRGCLG